MNEEYISRQIAVYKNNKVLIEFQDKLKAASIPSYAHIHADGELGSDGKKRHSLIGIQMIDYSNGTGNNSKIVNVNISPEEAKFILSRITAGFLNYSFQQEKIFGAKDEKGYAFVSKIRIIRAAKDNKGNDRKLPWYIEVENGKGIPMANANGGTYMKSGSYVQKNLVSVNLSDLELFQLLSRVSSYIDAWEKVVSASIILQGRTELAKRQTNNNNWSNQPTSNAA